MNQYMPERYTYRVLWSEEDQEHVGLCVEFPSLSWLAENQDDALNGIVKLVAEILDDMKKTGETIPETKGIDKDLERIVVDMELREAKRQGYLKGIEDTENTWAKRNEKLWAVVHWCEEAFEGACPICDRRNDHEHDCLLERIYA